MYTFVYGNVSLSCTVQGRKRKGPGRPKKHPMIVESDNEESEIVSVV